jgi:hypothetical protein
LKSKSPGTYGCEEIDRAVIMTSANKVLLHVQRWEFEHGNHKIIVENAVNIGELFSQERIRVDGDIVRDRQSTADVTWRWATVYETVWPTQRGEQRLEVQWRSGLMTIHARVLLDGTEQKWTDYFKGNWHGEKGVWPPGPDGL